MIFIIIVIEKEGKDPEMSRLKILSSTIINSVKKLMKLIHGITVKKGHTKLGVLPF